MKTLCLRVSLCKYVIGVSDSLPSMKGRRRYSSSWLLEGTKQAGDLRGDSAQLIAFDLLRAHNGNLY